MKFPSAGYLFQLLCHLSFERTCCLVHPDMDPREALEANHKKSFKGATHQQTLGFFWLVSF